MVTKENRRFYVYLLIWMAVDFVQAILTNIHSDEAYYAMYGEFLDWGYYDHPPMVALMTFLSSLVGFGNLSVRLLTVLMHGGTLLFVWKTVCDKDFTISDVNRFFIIASSLVMFVLYGFVTTPDAPILFFTAMFFFLYKRYLEKKSLVVALLIGVSIACMLYSKYMAVLVVSFVLVSNLKLLKDWRLWLVVIFAVALFVPHVLWQVNNDFPSLRYHLVLRNDSFSWKYPLEFIPNQLLIFNPVCFFLVIYFCWKSRRCEDRFLRACMFVFAGFIIFFWIMTIKGHSEPHWTIAASIPAIIVLFRQTRDEKWTRGLNYLVLPFSAIIVVGRICLCVGVASESTGFKDCKQEMTEVRELSAGKPVVFYSSFQLPSLYRYYTGAEGMALSSIYNRYTQYDILQRDKELQGKEVFAVSAYHFSSMQQIGDYELFYAEFSNFQGTNRVDIEVKDTKIENDSVLMDITLTNNYDIPFDFNHPGLPVMIGAMYMDVNDLKREYSQIPNDLQIQPHQTVPLQIKFKLMREIPFVICLANKVNISPNSKVMKL
ncbi:MAG: glycosyltransferase family 39 protein [Bacteroidales bacterium]|nr:glycosyltransferase family 39 protein [Bacteroidales bacterium]